MQFIEFQDRLAAYPVFSLKDVEKIFPKFSYRQLDRWGKKGYLKKVKAGFYCLLGDEISRDFLFYTANKICSPSYVSLEMALKHYGLIPEEIFQITSVGTKKTTHFDTSLGNFSYRHIKAGLYWGYRLVDFAGQKYLLAEPEKAILDYLYIHPNLKTEDDFREMRLNLDEFNAQIDLKKLNTYLVTFKNKALSNRVKIFLNTIQNDKS